MSQPIRVYLGAQTLIFLVAALIHFEVLFDGYPDREAGIAESVIGVVLLIGLISTWIFPASARTAGIIVQGFALLGTFVGLTLLFVVGPSTVLDVVIHLVMVVVLVTGLAATIRVPARV